MIEKLTEASLAMARRHVEGRLPPPDERGCRLWSGAILKSGYGSAYIGSRSDNTRKRVRAHRLVWELHHGPIPGGMLVMHSCDRPLCCAIEHLSLGTDSDNMQDMVAKGRAVFGDKSKAAKLTPDRVRLVRRLFAEGWTKKRIAALFGVSKTPIQLVLSGKCWWWVSDSENEDGQYVSRPRGGTP